MDFERFLEENHLNKISNIYYDTIEFEIDYLPSVEVKLRPYFQYGQSVNFRQRGAVVGKGVEVDFEMRGARPIKKIVADELKGTPYDITSEKAFYEFAPSSHYNINVSLIQRYASERKKGCLRAHFNFSIPKFVYGHNIALFPKCGDRNGYYLWRFVDFFLYYFFRLNRQNCNFEIKQLHLCYNCKFEDVKAFKLQDNLFKVVYNDMNTNTHNMNMYDGTITKKIEGGYIKIYDKYKEFYSGTGDFKKIVNYYYARYRNTFDRQTAKMKAVKEAEKVGKFAENVWRCEIELRPKLINQMFWECSKQKFFPECDKYFRAKSDYDVYMNMSRSVKLYIENHPLNEARRQSFLKFFEKYKGYMFGRAEFKAMMLGNANIKWLGMIDDVQLMKKFVSPLVIAHYRDILKICNIKMVVSPLQQSEYNTSSFVVMPLEGYIIDRGFEKMRKFVEMFTSLARKTGSMDLLSYWRINKDSIIGTSFPISETKQKQISVKFYNAILGHLVKKDRHIAEKNRAYMYNEKYCKLLAGHFGVSQGKPYVSSEIFSFEKNFSLNFVDKSKNLYICPIINNVLNKTIENYVYGGK